MSELVQAAAAPTVTALPPPAIDSADVIAVVPGTTPEDASRYASLATLAVTAAIWPTAMPPAPLPTPLYTVTLAVASRFARADPAGSPVVSESLGGYTYRLATPVGVDAAFGLSEDELEQLTPWLGRAGVYDVATLPATVPPPFNWWELDLDNPAT